MNAPHACVLLLCAVTGSAMPGCALLTKGDQRTARFFSLDEPSGHGGALAQAPTDSRAAAGALRLGPVSGAPHLGERLVRRDSAHGIVYYRDLRWTEPPELYLERRLARVLFEDRGLRHLVQGAGPTLEVQLTALDEVRTPQHLARIQLIALLHDEHLLVWEETLTLDQPIATKDGVDPALSTVDALGQIMRRAVDRIADRVVRKLRQHR